MNLSFGFGASIALIIFAICAPISYCTIQRGPPTSGADLELACINHKGEWKSDHWYESYTCSFPREKP